MENALENVVKSQRTAFWIAYCTDLIDTNSNGIKYVAFEYYWLEKIKSKASW